MGMFDTVYTHCLNCGKDITFQSKAGESNLSRYTITNVPAIIAEDLDGAEETCTCGTTMTIGLFAPLQRVSMYTTTTNEQDKWD